MDKGKTLIVWLKTGNTCMFEQVKYFNETMETIKFEYFGQSTQVKREAVIYLNNIAGWALEL